MIIIERVDLVLEQLNSILDFENSIIRDYIEDFDNYWDFINNIGNVILKIALLLNKNDYYEFQSGIWISKTAIIHPSAVINPPCIIGSNTEVRSNAFIRGNVIIGNDCIVGNSTEVKNSVLFNEVKIPHFNYVGDSILGYKSHLGAGTIISNVKSDLSFIKVKLHGSIYETNMKKLGAIIGDYVEVGCNAVITPGTVIRKNSNVYPLVMVRGEIEEDKIVKSQDDIVQKVKRKMI